MNFVSPPRFSGKAAGQFFTPAPIARSLVNWVIRRPDDSLIDPACGDGAILAHHPNSRGIERDPYAAWIARSKSPSIRVDNIDFFEWALEARERFDCAAGNPPFIRYQNFKGLSKASATSLCNALGVELSGLSSSWAAFLVVTVSLLRQGGRMAFVVPAEIGHAPYAVRVLDYLLRTFQKVQVVAARSKLFPRISEDCWLLYCEGKGGTANCVHFSKLEEFEECDAPPAAMSYCWERLKDTWHGRLRPLLVEDEGREAYLRAAAQTDAVRFGDFASVGIGYITGANDFFHLRPSQAAALEIPREFLVPPLRRGQFLPEGVLDENVVADWKAADEAYLLLRIRPNSDLPPSVMRYLESDAGVTARQTYKCRSRPLWYSVPGVTAPEYFLQYMAGSNVRLARNDAGAACTNSIHAVRIKDTSVSNQALAHWGSPLSRASCEFEGHPLGGGMLKLEPREASRLLFAGGAEHDQILACAAATLQSWRHQPER